LIGLPPSIVSRTANSRARSCSCLAIRNRYFARSLPGRSRHRSAYAVRAADTARSTSSVPASATVASFSSVAGSIVSKYRPLFGSTNRPSMNRPYRSSIRTMSVPSRATAYSHGTVFSIAPISRS
jgi:hypothetical protein